MHEGGGFIRRTADCEYEMGKIIEIEGTLIAFQWRSPHVRLKVSVSQNGQARPGERTVWDIEGSSLGVLRQTNPSPQNLRVGDRVRAAGEPSRRKQHRMFVLHLLQADGTELVFFPGLTPRWAGRAT